MPPSSAASAPGLNVIALISGGKDSLYSLLHCIRNGHKVVALANLHPEPRSSTDPAATSEPQPSQDTENAPVDEDIDSFMYQTIGHSVIPLYESALDIPLYRAAIKGGAVDTARIYRHDAPDQAAESPVPADSASAAAAPEDETESLVPLLRRIKAAHPEANAVSAGAILSTYQRTRIENVAARLGLVPLAWLWMYPSLPAPAARLVGEAGLLEDMAACGCDARIIKVASGGLDDGFLWENVSGDGGAGRALRGRIAKAMRRFAAAEDVRGAVLGEGGEYETLALDGPGFLWKRRIEVERREVRSAEGGVAYVRLLGARCVAKPVDGLAYTPQDVRRPALLDEVFGAALEDVGSAVSLETTGSNARARAVPWPAWSRKGVNHRQSRSTWTIGNLVAPEAGPGAGEQMRAIVDQVQELLSSFEPTETGPRSTDDIVFTTVLLRSMADFALMNEVYVSLFKKPNPPARVTVACGDALPANVKVMISLVVDLGPRSCRQGLHVQSRSYWAPANIGPYSQAMLIPLRNESRLVYIAGQIPLEPASMEVVTQGKSWLDGYRLRAVLSLQHLWRIGEAMQVDWWLGTVAFLTGREYIETQAQVAWHLWKKMHIRPPQTEEDEEGPQLDVWDIKYGRRADEVVPDAVSSNLPRFSVLGPEASVTVPSFLAVEVHELPRGSDIEWQGLGSRCQQAKLESREDYISTTADGRYTYESWEIETHEPQSLEERLNPIKSNSCQGQGLSQMVLYTTQPVPEGFWPGQVVPCRSVWGSDARQLAAAVIVQREDGLGDEEHR
ncbi:uncharacterized protein N7459_005755 [Penicillium hispanicum]|uniref:uncharacterized protein n=1 Tax=Penicillium hispanicum TaxID=1080232 RepID=UPI00253F9DCD|nr:uncharacterized protein N7459_005755 [Penicillium hispanicum]KAJ5579770.1 hypothetical protein N7459_005755 [Penicillium hispanicum]